jgi:hypothetical protein
MAFAQKPSGRLVQKSNLPRMKDVGGTNGKLTLYSRTGLAVGVFVLIWHKFKLLASCLACAFFFLVFRFSILPSFLYTFKTVFAVE